MNDKIKKWIIYISIFILIVAVFFAGRSCGSNQQRQLADQIKTELAASIEGQRILTEFVKREREYAESLESINRRLVERVGDLQESIDSGYIRLEERIKGQRDFIERLTELNSGSRDTNKSIGNKLRESIGIVDELFSE